MGKVFGLLFMHMEYDAELVCIHECLKYGVVGPYDCGSPV